ncbi:MAG: hypothetical protein ACU0C9_01795, partial [Paracoccaceae bacterium]
MGYHQFAGWNYSDFSNNIGSAARGPVVLAEFAEPFTIEVSDTEPDQHALAPQLQKNAVLSQAITIGDEFFAEGSRIVPAIVLKTAGQPAQTFVIGKIIPVGNPISDTDTRIVFTSATLMPGQELTFGSMENSPQAGPGKNCFARGTLIETPHGALP